VWFSRYVSGQTDRHRDTIRVLWAPSRRQSNKVG